MRHLLKTADQVGAANRSAAMLAHQPLYKRRADVLILDERADALGFVIGESLSGKVIFWLRAALPSIGSWRFGSTLRSFRARRRSPYSIGASG